jgi:hypothetical protein
VEGALEKVHLQLDFFSLTGHSSWPDLKFRNPPDEVCE